MKTVRIEAVASHTHLELSSRLELPLDSPCCVRMGQIWHSHQAACPPEFCSSAWQALYPYVFALANGAPAFFDGWMKKPGTALVSCPDGFRPVSFLLEVVD